MTSSWVAAYGGCPPAAAEGNACAAGSPRTGVDDVPMRRPSPSPPPARSSGCGRRGSVGSDSRSSTPAISRSPSSDNLFVDPAVVGRSNLPPSSGLFLNGLSHWEMQPLETIDEAVGFAKSGITKGSRVSGVFTLVASAMGAGCLSLPHMFRQSGLALGLILLACGSVLAHVGLVVLMSCARYTGCRSFAELVSLSSQSPGGGGRSPAVDAVIALYGLAAVLIYMMLIGDFLGGIAHSAAFGHSGASRQSLILGSLLVVFPLSVPKSVTALRYISIFSTASIAFMTTVVVLKTPGLLLASEAGGRVRWFAGDASTTLRSFSIALFSFNAHTNAVPVATALDHPRASVIWQVSLISVLIELAIYSLIATCGYLSFLDGTEQDFIRNYDDDDWIMFIVRCVYSVPVVLGVPINLSPAVASVKALAKGAAAAPAIPGKSRRPDSGFRPCAGTARHVAIVVVVLGVCAALAVWCEAIADVIGLFGSFFGTLICLVWPRRIYHCVFGELHSRSVGVPLRLVLFSATAVGAIAFVLQALDFAGGPLARGVPGAADAAAP